MRTILCLLCFIGLPICMVLTSVYNSAWAFVGVWITLLLDFYLLTCIIFDDKANNH